MPAKTSQINALLVANKHKVNQSECVSVRIKTPSGSNYRSETSFSSKFLCRGSFCFSDLCLAFAVFCWTHTNLPSGNCLFTGSKVEQRKRPKKLKWEYLFFFHGRTQRFVSEPGSGDGQKACFAREKMAALRNSSCWTSCGDLDFIILRAAEPKEFRVHCDYQPCEEILHYWLAPYLNAAALLEPKLYWFFSAAAFWTKADEFYWTHSQGAEKKFLPFSRNI